MNNCCVSYIALGSNLKNPIQQIKKAIKNIATVKDITLESVSRLYQSPPLGLKQQPYYINAVVRIKTMLTPITLLYALQNIENIQGRTRIEHWGSRTLDLDILLYEHLTMKTNSLTIPHPSMKQRNFVLQPLFDITPNLIFPDGSYLKDILASVSQVNLKVLSRTKKTYRLYTYENLTANIGCHI